MKPEPADAKKIRLLRYTNKLLKDQGYGSVFEFVRTSKVPYSMETVRKAFNECDYKRLGPDTLAIILKHLNVPTPEIRRVLQEMTDDQELWTLLPGTEGSCHLIPAEEAWVKIYRALKPEAVQGLLGTLSLVASKDISEEIQTLKRSE